MRGKLDRKHKVRAAVPDAALCCLLHALLRHGRFVEGCHRALLLARDGEKGLDAAWNWTGIEGSIFGDLNGILRM